MLLQDTSTYWLLINWYLKSVAHPDRKKGWHKHGQFSEVALKVYEYCSQGSKNWLSSCHAVGMVNRDEGRLSRFPSLVGT